MEDGCRRSSTTSVDRTKVSAKHVIRRKAQKSTGFTIAQNGTNSDGRSQKPSENGNNKPKLQRKIEVSSSTLQVKADGTGVTSGWGMPAEGFKGHVNTDGSLLGTGGKWGACGWSVVELSYDEQLGPLHGMYGSVEGRT